MTSLTIDRITNLLEKQFTGHISMADWKGRPESDTKKAFLSRALAALCIKSHAGVDPITAANAVTDGFGDNGLDAVYFDQKDDALLLVQSKWSEDGNRPIDADATATLATGVRDLLAARFDRFNEKVRTKEAEVTAALYSERPIKIVIITAHTAAQAPLADHVKRKIDDLVEELNDAVPIASSAHYNQAGIYGLITSESAPPKIKLQISLKDWGLVDKPFLAYYGRVHVDEIAQWWTDHGNALFRHNLRLFYSNSDVNDALKKTLANDPANFWYFNNGITVICDSLTKAAVGAPGRIIGLFACEGASIVNGAQTVGTIGAHGPIKKDSVASADSDNVESWVQVRIISLDKCPPEFSRAITRAANLQNAVGNREFAAMDPVQHRLATEFTLDKRKYVYKQGEPDPKGDEGCSIVEATQALACANSISLAVQVKREIGALWADTSAPPYTDLFNEKLTSARLWRSILIMRAVDETLQPLRFSRTFRADYIGVHLNRVILHLVFQDPSMRALRHEQSDEGASRAMARKTTDLVFEKVAAYIEKNHPEEYLASFSKNATKCEALVGFLLNPPDRNAPSSPMQNLLPFNE
jgi:hypothetical protein